MTGRFSVIKMAIFFKLIFRFCEITIKIIACFSEQIDKLNLNFIWQEKDLKSKVLTKDMAGTLTLPNLRVLINLQESRKYNISIRKNIEFSGTE